MNSKKVRILSKVQNIIIICFLLTSLPGKAQDFNTIKANRDYLWGYGKGADLKAADREALKDLIGQISTTVESNYQYILKEEGGNLHEVLEGIVKTYSSSTLSNAERLVVENDEGVEVMRYIRREDMSKIFQQRESRIRGYVKNALNAENEGRIGDALRYYYWAQVLLNSHPDNHQMFFNFEGYDYLLFSWIPDRINRIFSMLTVKTTQVITKDPEEDIYFTFAYQGKKVYNIDYSFWNGRDWSELIGTTNGEGVIELYGKAEQSMEAIRIKIEYEFANKSKLDPELPDVLEVIHLPYYKQAVKVVDKEVKSLKTETQKQDSTEGLSETKSKNTPMDRGSASFKNTIDTNCVSPDILKQKIDKLIISIKSGNDKTAKTLFTEDGFEVYQRLIKYGKARVMPYQENLKITCLGKEAIARSIPFIFNFPTNQRKFVENLSFTFDSAGLIKNITFSLSQLSLEGILSHTKWNDLSKWYIIDFLENYQTAYALERLDYIDKIFSDDALIIVGRKLKKGEPIDKMYAVLQNDQYQYIKVSKKEYIERLNSVFENNEFVNIQFEDCQVAKRDNSTEVYGIQIAQDYFSTHYADKGYLFLMVDLNDSIHPKIYVRSWQPEKNPDGSIIGLGTFFN